MFFYTRLYCIFCSILSSVSSLPRCTLLIVRLDYKAAGVNKTIGFADHVCASHDDYHQHPFCFLQHAAQWSKGLN